MQASIDIDRLKDSRRESLPFEVASSRGRRWSTNSNGATLKSRHYSLGTIYECHNTRFANAYKSIDKTKLHDFRQSLSSHEEIDAGEPPPVDESLFFENLLVSKNVDLNRIKTTLWAALTTHEMRALLDIEKGNLSNFSFHNEQLKNTSYLWACFRNLTHLLPKLESLGANANYVQPDTGMNAVHVAALDENYDCLEYLVLKKQMNTNIPCKISNYTPLHFAALTNSSAIVELLLDNGAKIDLDIQEAESVLHSAIRVNSIEVVKLLIEKGADVTRVNNLGESSLHFACLVNSIAAVELLLSTPGVNVNVINHIHRTPLHYAVMSNSQGHSSINLVNFLLKNGALVNVSDRLSLTPLHIAALNELSDCVESLIWAGADVSATTATGHTALNIILRKLPETLHVFRDRLDSCIKLQRPVMNNKEYEMRLHFDILFPKSNPCETSLINAFVQEHRKDLLSHPLVMAFLHLKWEKIKKFYHIHIFVYTLTVIFITAYVLTALAYKCYTKDESSDYKLCGIKRLTGFLFKKPIIEIQWYLALLLVCVLVPRKILDFFVYQSFKQYFSNIENVLDSILYISVFATSFVYTGETYDWQNYVGAFGVLCGWTNLMLMVGQLPTFGTYVAMFTHIQFEFAKLLLAYSGLLIGFALSFCVIFVSEPSFANPLTGLIKVLAMMAGELDFEGLINQDIFDSSYIIYHPLSVCSQIFITLFIVFVTVILMNLLVGIAVHDIQSLRNHAGLTKLVRQTKMILFTEVVIKNEKLPKLFRKWVSHYNINIGNKKLILVVKPLNPLEKRLPLDILKAAFEIGQNNHQIEHRDSDISKHTSSWLKHDVDEDLKINMQKTLDNLLFKIEEQTAAINLVHEQLDNANKLLEFIYKQM